MSSVLETPSWINTQPNDNPADVNNIFDDDIGKNKSSFGNREKPSFINEPSTFEPSQLRHDVSSRDSPPSERHERSSSSRHKKHSSIKDEPNREYVKPFTEHHKQVIAKTPPFGYIF